MGGFGLEGGVILTGLPYHGEGDLRPVPFGVTRSAF